MTEAELDTALALAQPEATALEAADAIHESYAEVRTALDELSASLDPRADLGAWVGNNGGKMTRFVARIEKFLDRWRWIIPNRIEKPIRDLCDLGQT